MTHGEAIKAGLIHVVTCPRTSGSAMVGLPSSRESAVAFLPEHTARCPLPADQHAVMDIRDFAKR